MTTPQNPEIEGLAAVVNAANRSLKQDHLNVERVNYYRKGFLYPALRRVVEFTGGERAAMRALGLDSPYWIRRAQGKDRVRKRA